MRQQLIVIQIVFVMLVFPVTRPGAASYSWWTRSSRELERRPYFAEDEERVQSVSSRSGSFGVRDYVSSIATLPFFPHLCDRHEAVVQLRVREDFGDCDVEGGMIGRVGRERSKDEIDSARTNWALNHDNEQICGVIDRCQCSENENVTQTLICRDDEDFSAGTRCICAPSDDPNSQELIELASDQGAQFEQNAARSVSAVFVGGTSFSIDDDDEDAVLRQFNETYETGHLKLIKKTQFGTSENDRLEAVVLDREGVLYGAGTTRGGMATCISEISTSVVNPDGPKTNCGGSDVFLSIWQPTNETESGKGYVEMHSVLQLGSTSDESVSAIAIVGGFHELVSASGGGFDLEVCSYTYSEENDMMIFDSTNEDVQDSDFCAYKERVFVIGDTTGQLGDCFFGESCNDGHKYIFIATLDIPQWDVYTESTGQVVRDLLHTRFVSINRAGFTGSDDVAVDIVSGIHGGAWVLGNSNISFTTTTTSVRCVDDTSSTVPCTQGHGVLLLRTDILGQTQDAIRMQGDYLKAHALGMDVHTGSLYVFGITKSFGVCTNRLGCFSSQLHLSLIRFDDTHKNSALELTWAVRWSSGNVPELPVSIFSLNKSGRFALVINEMGVDIDNNLTSSSCAVGQHCGSNDENVALYELSTSQNVSELEFTYKVLAGTQGVDAAIAATRTNYDAIAVAGLTSSLPFEGLSALHNSNNRALGTNADDVLMITFSNLRCGPGEYPNYDLRVCAKCEPGTYSESGKSCVPCDAKRSNCTSVQSLAQGGDFLSGTSKPIALAGYQGDDDHIFRKCRVASDGTSACEYGGVCAEGHMEISNPPRVCSECVDGYIWNRGRCCSCTVEIFEMQEVKRLVYILIMPCLLFLLVYSCRFVRGIKVAMKTIKNLRDKLRGSSKSNRRRSRFLMHKEKEETQKQQHLQNQTTSQSTSTTYLQASVVRIVVTHIQLLLVMSHSVVVPWPSLVMSFFHFLDAFDTSASLASSLQCLGVNVYDHQDGTVVSLALMSVMFVIGSVVSVWCVYWFALGFKRIQRIFSMLLRGSRYDLHIPEEKDFHRLSEIRIQVSRWRHIAFTITLWILVMTFVPTSRALVSALRCRHVSDDLLVLRSHPIEDCPSWDRYLLLCSSLVMVAFGFPYLVHKLIKMERKERHETPWLHELDFVWPLNVMWKDNQVYAETLESVRQLIFAMFWSLTMRDSKQQILLGLCACIVTVSMWSLCSPFRYRTTRTMSMFSVCVFVITMLCAFIARTKEDNVDDTILNFLVIGSNLTFMFFAVVVIWISRGDVNMSFCIKMMRRKRVEQGDKEEEFHQPSKTSVTCGIQTEPFTEPIREQYELSDEILRLKGELREQYNTAKGLSEFEETMRKKRNKLKSKSRKRGKLLAKSIQSAKDLQRENFEIFRDLKKRNALDILEGSKKKKGAKKRQLDSLESLTRLESLTIEPS